MIDAAKPRLDTAQVAAWLAGRLDAPVAEFAPLSGGFWSSAFAYESGGDKFVLRLSDMREGYDIDAAAMRFASPDLPVPEIVDRGTALGLNFAISRRHHGIMLESVPAVQAKSVTGLLQKLLAALRAVPGRSDDAVQWYRPEAPAWKSWHDWLRNGLVDDPASRVGGWRSKLAADPRVDAVFEACVARIEELLPRCPERRDLVHGDLLHQNVLVSEDVRRVTAIFSWKCSVRGDFLFDVAWCTFWGPWYPGIEAADPWGATLAADDLTEADLDDAAARHHCYELQIAASHFGWNAWTGDEESLAAVTDAAERVLQRGPLPM